jgi:hypothetical protein
LRGDFFDGGGASAASGAGTGLGPVFAAGFGADVAIRFFPARERCLDFGYYQEKTRTGMTQKEAGKRRKSAYPRTPPDLSGRSITP